MDLRAFTRAFHLKGSKIAWLLGAGASAAAGVPTAAQLTWSFKQLIFCTEQAVSPALCSDLGDPGIRERIQNYFDARARHPKLDDDDEYGHFFELAFPRPQDRQAYIEKEFTGKSPSYGHLVLAVLMQLKKTRLLFTTNFDSLIERAFDKLADSGHSLHLATLDSAQLGITHLQNEQFPLLVKLHGDFRSDRLKNIPDELQTQDKALRQCLIESTRRFGLAIVGYSGRDESIMDALNDAISSGMAFPHGLFWLHRPERTLLPSVQAFLKRATDAKIDAHVIEIGTFDEVMHDLTVLETDIPESVRKQFRGIRPMLGAGSVPVGQPTWPVVRMNALKVESFPATCRVLKEATGSGREVRERVIRSHGSISAVRHKDTILAFGADDALRLHLQGLYKGPLDIASLAVDSVFGDSHTQGLLYQLLIASICSAHPQLSGRTGRRNKVFVDPDQAGHPSLQGLRAAVNGPLSGILPSRKGVWTEGLRLQLDNAGGSRVLLCSPWVEMQLARNQLPEDADREVIRERIARRYNRQWNSLVVAWIELLSRGDEVFNLVHPGCQTTISLQSSTAYAWSLKQ